MPNPNVTPLVAKKRTELVRHLKEAIRLFGQFPDDAEYGWSKMVCESFTGAEWAEVKQMVKKIETGE